MFDEVVEYAKAFLMMYKTGVIDFYVNSYNPNAKPLEVQTTTNLFYKALAEKGLDCQRKPFKHDSNGNVTEWECYFYYDGVYFFTLEDEQGIDEQEEAGND